MDEALLGGESSSGGRNKLKSNGRKVITSAVFHRRSDVIAYGSDYQKAAALVDLAEDGIGLPEQILDQADYKTSAKLYFFFIRFDFLWTINYFALLTLNFLEKPLWCLGNTEYSCNEREYYYLGQLPYLTSTESLVYEGVTLVILLMHNLFPISYEGFSIYWKNRINKLKVTLLILLVVDMCIYVLYLTPLEFSLPFRIAPYIRVVFFILIIPDLRESIVILAGMLGTYFNVLALSFLFLLFSSWVAFVMFEDTEQGKTIFTSFGTTVYQMFVLFTTSNNPDVWIPAYKASRWYSLFFILYALLGIYFVTNLILAVVYDSFKDQLAKIVVGKDRMRTRILMKAFNLLDKNNLGYLNKEQCIKLFEDLNKYRTLPNISLADYESIFDALDDSKDFKINADEFADLCNAIALQFPKEESLPIFEYFPNVYNSTPSQSLKTFIRGSYFGYVVAFVLVLNLVAVVIETTLDVQNSSGQKVWQSVEFVFGWLYVAEMLLKIYAYGFVNYWRDGLNRFDCIITLVIVIGETATFLSPDDVGFLSNGEWIRYLLLARVLRLIRILMHVQQYRAFVATFLTLIPSLMPYLGTIFCIMCMYCSLGIQLFGGLVNAGNLALENTELAENDRFASPTITAVPNTKGYLLFNFNDYPNGMVTLFNLLVLGNWQAWMQSYKELTGTNWTYAYFVSFYLVTILLLLNLVIAFVLEAFFAEMEMEADGKGEDKEGQKDRRRSIGQKTRSQRVDALLHHMLGTELEQSTESTDV